ncbi:hypothetical protein [Bacillus testis]|uniref:hypothetical protein n=1 Tax=Bacillus testis TaxID=1622072 RepID=UPI00067E7152|nr:hypothetical protein [Bacillus testis]
MKYSKGIQSVLPLGMIFGCTIGVIIGILFKPSFLVFTVSIGTVIGFLIGIAVSYMYHKQEKS